MTGAVGALGAIPAPDSELHNSGSGVEQKALWEIMLLAFLHVSFNLMRCFLYSLSYMGPGRSEMEEKGLSQSLGTGVELLWRKIP